MPRIETLICDDGCGEVIPSHTHITVSYTVFAQGEQIQARFNLVFKNAQHLLNYLIQQAAQPNPVQPVAPVIPTPTATPSSAEVEVRIEGTDV